MLIVIYAECCIYKPIILGVVMLNPIIKEYSRGKYHCTIDLLFDWFGLACFAHKNKKLSAVIQLIPNQSNWRSTVQWYFPPIVFPAIMLSVVAPQ